MMDDQQSFTVFYLWLCSIPRWGFFGFFSTVQLWVVGIIFAIWPEQDLYNTTDTVSETKSPYPQLKDYNPYY